MSELDAWREALLASDDDSNPAPDAEKVWETLESGSREELISLANDAIDDPELFRALCMAAEFEEPPEAANNTSNWAIAGGVVLLLAAGLLLAVPVVMDSLDEPSNLRGEPIEAPETPVSLPRDAFVLTWEGSGRFRVEVLSEDLDSLVRSGELVEPTWTVPPDRLPMQGRIFWRVTTIDSMGTTTVSSLVEARVAGE